MLQKIYQQNCILDEYLLFYIKSATLQSVDSFVFTYGSNVHNYSPFLRLLTRLFATSGHENLYINVLAMAY